jgi:RNA polymerase primary sigma factor
MTGTSVRKIAVESESLDQYLREISAYPLIDRAEEAELARRIRAGDACALETLVRSNLRFVVSVAKRYQNQGVSLADLINEGNIGLMRAAQKFDETKGIKFISYAVWWIRQAILQALAEQSRIVRVPLSRAGTLHRIGKRSSTLTQELGREPTLEEIAGELELPRRRSSTRWRWRRPTSPSTPPSSPARTASCSTTSPTSSPPAPTTSSTPRR